VGLFRPYQQGSPTNQADGQSGATTPAATDSSPQNPVQKKDRPTPSRREAEAARMQRLHPKPTKKELREQVRRADERRRHLKAANHEDRPQMVLMRNYVDSRWSVTEFMWPILLILLAGSLLGYKYPTLVIGVTIGLWVMMGIAVANMAIFWQGYKRELHNRLPGTTYKGMLMGMASRMITLRRVRNPGCAISRGDSY